MEPVALQAVDGLADGAHLAALEAEGRSVDDGLVTVVERMKAPVPVDPEQAAGCSQDGGAPAARLGMGQEAVQGGSGVVQGADRIPADQGDATDHPVGNKGLPGHEPFLVGPQREGR